MNRTNEFLKLVVNTDIPQNKVFNTNFGIDIQTIDIKIQKLINHLKKVTIYEKFKAQPLIKEIYEEINKLKSIQAYSLKKNIQIYNNMNDIIKEKTLKYTLITRNYEKKFKKTVQTSNITNIEDLTKNNIYEYSNLEINHNKPSQVHIQEELSQNGHNISQEQYYHRHRIINTISEMSNIMENINLHVNLQELELKRIDDIIDSNTILTNKIFTNLKDLWITANEKRRTMIKFFSGWIILIMLFWIWKK